MTRSPDMLATFCLRADPVCAGQPDEGAQASFKRRVWCVTRPRALLSHTPRQEPYCLLVACASTASAIKELQTSATCMRCL